MSEKSKQLVATLCVLSTSSMGWMRIPLLAVLLAALPLSTAVAQEGSDKDKDWPTYMHDNSRAGGSPAELLPPFEQRWELSSVQAPEGAWPGPGGKTIEKLKLVHRVRFDDVFHVAIAKGLVFFGSSVDHSVRCVDLQTGAEQWSFITGAAVRLAPTVAGSRVYVGSDDGFAYCLSAKTGDLIWKVRAGPADERILARGRMVSRWPVRTGILLDEGIAYFGAGTFPHETVFLYAVNAKDGKVIWRNDEISQKDAGRNDLTPQGYLLATKDLLFVPSGRTLPAAIDKQTGRLVHKQLGGGKQIGGAQALLADDKILSMGEHHILALNQRKGDIVSKLSGKQMTLVGDLAYIAADGEILAVNRQRYVEANRSKHPRAVSAAQLRKALVEHAYPKHAQALKEAQRAGKSSAQELTALRERASESRSDYTAKKAELSDLVGILWRTPCVHESNLILAGGTLVVGGIGEVVALSAETGETLWSSDVDGEASGLATASGHLVVSTTAGKIYGFAEKRRRAARTRTKEAVTAGYAADDLSAKYQAAAAAILERSGVTRGFCLVIGGERGRLAYELARQSDLVIQCVESSPAKVRAARKALMPTGFYGTRVTVDHLDLSILPYPSYFANLVVCDSAVLGADIAGIPQEVARCVKPHGGVICLGPDADERYATWMEETGLELEGASHVLADGWDLLRRSALPGAASWTHQYGNPGASSSIDDQRVRDGLSVLWYGDPGPSSMVNRHQGAAAPLSVAGRMFVQGDVDIEAYDSYNGLKLWDRENPGALRTGVFKNYEPGNMVADEESLFTVIGSTCLRLDAATGELLHTYALAPSDAQAGKTWGYLAVHNGVLIGSTTKREMIPEGKRSRGIPTKSTATDKVFGFDVASGQVLWVHEGKSISHTAIAVDDDRVYLIDSTLTAEQRVELLAQDMSEMRQLTGAARDLAEERIKRIDARLAIGIDAQTGEQIWSQVIDVTDCTDVGIGAGRLVLMAHAGHVVLCGANANGHYWKQFLKGDFERRRLVVLDAQDGHKVWARDANYRHRPLIVGQNLIAEPWSFDLSTGEQRMRVHPLTGEETAWLFARPGHHCGAVAATPGMLLFRSKFTAYYDMDSDSGTRHFAGHRLGCWINAIPADGLVLVPEASAGCACLFSLTSTVVFEPRRERQLWGVFGAAGATTPIRHMALNMGAPGDRRDEHGKLWLGYPRPSSRKGIDLPLRLAQKFLPNGGYYAHNSESVAPEGAEVSWVFASGARGLQSCSVPLIGKGEEAATYTVRLSFVSSDKEGNAPLPFDIRLQGETVVKALNLRFKAGGKNKAYTHVFKKVAVTAALQIELVPKGDNPDATQLPRLCAIEVLRTGAEEIRVVPD